MEIGEMCRLISCQSHKLKAIRQQAANGNETNKQLLLAAIARLLQDQSTHQHAYEEISQFVITADPILARAVADLILKRVVKAHLRVELDPHIIFWMRAYDGSVARREYPNYKEIMSGLKIKNEERELSGKLGKYYQEFLKNYNHLHDQRVQFFEDFDDDAVSDSIGDQSQLEQIVYLTIMQLKASRQKIQKQKLSSQALQQQVNKLKYFVTMKPQITFTSQEQAQYEKQIHWAKDFLVSYQLNHSNASVDKTFNIEQENESMRMMSRKDFEQVRRSKEPNKREMFQDSVDLRSSVNTVLVDASPIRKIKDSGPVYNPNRDSFQLPPDQLEEQEISGDDLKVINYKDKALKSKKINSSSIPEQQSLHKTPQQFSVTGNYFRNSEKAGFQTDKKSATGQVDFSRKDNTFLSPSRATKLKLSEFTSNKKARKQQVPRQLISQPEAYIVNAYTCHFGSFNELSKFRRDCLSNSFALLATDDVIVQCDIRREIGTEILIEILFRNLSDTPLQIQNVYKIPKCFKLEKKSQISKRFTLHTQMRHAFTLDVQQFPLEACLITLSYRSSTSGLPFQVCLPIPITIINFVEYLHNTKLQWLGQWGRLQKLGRKMYNFTKFVEVDRHVVKQEIQWTLKDYFINIGQTQGLSVQDFGCCCYYSSFGGIKFLLKLSVRVDNVISLQAVSCREVLENEVDFIQYVVNVWMMLLSKLHL